jgi:D-3-phosphoglycerate dehydrogenase
LKFIASGTTGLDHIDIDYCASHNIAVLSLQGETDFLRDVHATAEHTVALMLALLRKIPFAHNDVCQGRWDREAWQGSELYGKRIGIVGCGRVGTQVMNMLLFMGGDMMYCDNRVLWHQVPTGQFLENAFLDGVLRKSDIVSLHVPLNDSTRGMIGEPQFRLMKPTAYLVNTSRGAVVDEDALLWALREARIKGAALDVLNGEPLVNRRLVDYAATHDNLIITPHLGGNTAESRLKTQLFMCRKIAQFIGGVSHDASSPVTQASESGIR